MKSIAIWWDNKDETIQIHLDVNLWRRDDQEGSFIEFGIRINKGDPKTLFVEMPFAISGQFEDMSVKIDADVGQVLFNDQITLSSQEGLVRELKPSAAGKIFLCQISTDRYKIEDIQGRGRIAIFISKYKEEIPFDDKDIPLYFRFRIKSASRIYEIKNENYFYLDGLFRRSAILDLNINSPRKLPNTLVSKIKNINFQSINMFLISAGIIGFDFQNEQLKRSRILEDKGWEKYNPYNIQQKRLTKDKKQEYVAYHWKKDDKPFSEYSLFLKFQFSTKSILAILITIFIILSLGTLGGIAGNYITTKCFNSFNDMNSSSEKKSELNQ